MPTAARFIAIDWGTTHRRIIVVDADGTVLARAQDAKGILAMDVDAYASDIAAIRAQHGGLPVLCAGMVGSNRGWVDAGYVATPADAHSVARDIHWVVPGEVGIVPGVAHRSDAGVDVMRGEEVQIIGALEGDSGPRRFCLPGTHCKWVTAEGGRIVASRTSMTGEVFALLRDASTLTGLLGDGDGTGFRAGLADAGSGGGVLSLIFQARAHRAAGLEGPRAEPDYVSGVLIGDDVRANLGDPDVPVTIVGDTALAALYAEAIATYGGQSDRVDGDAAFVAGITQLWEMSR
jgi:2-dehydro-3-deoxygalactonokinase